MRGDKFNGDELWADTSILFFTGEWSLTTTSQFAHTLDSENERKKNYIDRAPNRLSSNAKMSSAPTIKHNLFNMCDRIVHTIASREAAVMPFRSNNRSTANAYIDSEDDNIASDSIDKE